MHERFKSLQNFGEKELEKLQDSKVVVVGLGATGSVMAEHLARHGVELLVIDRDYLEKKDLYTSNLYSKDQVEEALPKAVAAKQKLEDFTEIEAKVESLKPRNIDFLKDSDLVLDGTDNLETRFLINDYSKKENTPWVYTAAVGEKGYSMLFDSKCFSCVFEEINAGTLDTCETAGIMREVSSRAASLSAEKAVNYLSGKDVEEELETTSGESFEVESAGCEVCQEEKFPHLESSSGAVSVCGENKFQAEVKVGEETFERLEEASDETIASNDYLLRVLVNGKEFTLFQDRAIVEARDQGQAESRVSEILGV